mmetsp:Transcript_1712/g.2359  ORF Transcript_1712/g.2359 Transcript_1712/m.2359 type:complete len:561 (-) Transcript_1712:320-2002(-)
MTSCTEPKNYDTSFASLHQVKASEETHVSRTSPPKHSSSLHHAKKSTLPLSNHIRRKKLVRVKSSKSTKDLGQVFDWSFSSSMQHHHQQEQLSSPPSYLSSVGKSTNVCVVNGGTKQTTAATTRSITSTTCSSREDEETLTSRTIQTHPTTITTSSTVPSSCCRSSASRSSTRSSRRQNSPDSNSTSRDDNSKNNNKKKKSSKIETKKKSKTKKKTTKDTTLSREEREKIPKTSNAFNLERHIYTTKRKSQEQDQKQEYNHNDNDDTSVATIRTPTSSSTTTTSASIYTSIVKGKNERQPFRKRYGKGKDNISVASLPTQALLLKPKNRVWELESLVALASVLNIAGYSQYCWEWWIKVSTMSKHMSCLSERSRFLETYFPSSPSANGGGGGGTAGYGNKVNPAFVGNAAAALLSSSLRPMVNIPSSIMLHMKNQNFMHSLDEEQQLYTQQHFHVQKYQNQQLYIGTNANEHKDDDPFTKTSSTLTTTTPGKLTILEQYQDESYSTMNTTQHSAMSSMGSSSNGDETNSNTATTDAGYAKMLLGPYPQDDQYSDTQLIQA